MITTNHFTCRQIIPWQHWREAKIRFAYRVNNAWRMQSRKLVFEDPITLSLLLFYLILVSQFSNYRRGCGVAILLAWTAGSYLRSMIFRLPKNLQSYFIPCISIWTFPSVCHPPPSSHSAIITPRHNGYDHPMSPSISSILILILLNVNEPIQRHDTICTKIALLIGIQLYPML